MKQLFSIIISEKMALIIGWLLFPPVQCTFDCPNFSGNLFRIFVFINWFTILLIATAISNPVFKDKNIIFRPL